MAAGLPTHPLVVHAPVVLLPLAAIGVVVMLVRHEWYLRYRWATLVVGAVGALGATVAASTGEELEHEVARGLGADAQRVLHEHVEAGDAARAVAIVFALVLAAYVLVPWFLARRAGLPDAGAETPMAVRDRRIRHGLAALTVMAAAASVVTVIDAGHSGATSVWDADTPSADVHDAG